nr:hypothetical protein [Prochloraceae cyanobacterium]
MNPTWQDTEWRDTDLYKNLKSKESSNSKLIESLDEALKIIQEGLDEETTVEIPPDTFTLYDPKRAFRVAQRINQIIFLSSLSQEEQMKLSNHELGLLLLSAYLLDICLTLKLGKVSLYHDCLLSGKESSQLSEEEINEFEEWLNDEGSGFEIPLSLNKSDAKIRRQADRLITYYCR